MNTSTKKKFKKTFGILLDVLITIALIMSMVVAIIVTAQRTAHGFAGYGTVQSNSMKASGLNVGDVVKVRKKNAYVLGDIIVFYRAPKIYDKPFDEETVKNCEIWIHEVVDVSTDSLGRRTYLTKGSSNGKDDGVYVPQDYILGKATKLSAPAIVFLNFVCTVKGIILVVEIPCGVVLVYLVCDLVMLLGTDPKATSSKKQKIAVR